MHARDQLLRQPRLHGLERHAKRRRQRHGLDGHRLPAEQGGAVLLRAEPGRHAARRREPLRRRGQPRAVPPEPAGDVERRGRRHEAARPDDAPRVVRARTDPPGQHVELPVLVPRPRGRPGSLQLQQRALGRLLSVTSSGRPASRRPDELDAEVVVDVHHQRALHATLLRLFGLDPRELTFRHGGLDRELAGVSEANVIEGLLG
ncbi:MAG: DUF1501 domain-containing protein [Planctomycetes bacterium]|nr:DUF1501 domain-containing protein [Planctomycetota bacterium]